MNAGVQTLSQNNTSSGVTSIRGPSQLQASSQPPQNVGAGERMVSSAAGAILVMQGLGKRDLVGLLIAGVGGALAYRGATGHCSAYQALGLDTAKDNAQDESTTARGTRISQSLLIN